MARIRMAWTVECMEIDCGWAYGNVVKTDVEWQATNHRRQHELREAEARNAQSERDAQ